ncbi:MAG: hypothetical protein AVDCRST_MAG13-3444 [uncultured Solirubrobacteraceae bacterium]|uniref:DUF2617 family protein n=1 Tax=uncultured Solirubrobacteraceae bacterium TaxID=1162706 RepID=A0A6J4TF80_9ACTN|nr:MAG: hypothetical protein AVDCRST_MAG13-3444 [uncultured Solirubrobacteraceae bacterium]
MRVDLTVPYADVRAADLTLELGLAPVPALEVLRVPLGSGVLELRLLGHSHQARAELPGAAFSETVRCAPGARGGLPARSTDAAGPWAYAFTAAVEPLDPRALEGLAARVAADPRGLVGIFGADPGALTALRAAPLPGTGEAGGGLAWETWHAYPQSGELVRTRAEVRPA